MPAKLYVGNLAYTTTEDDLRVLFSQAGSVQSIDVIMDRDSGQSKGFAFVTMSTHEDAQKAIGMLNAFALHNRELNVSLARPREERNSPPGRGGYGGRRAHKPRGGNRRY